MTTAFEYTLKAGGLEREEDYPYTGKDRGPCKFDKTKIAASVSNFSVISVDEDQVAANLVKHGPLAGKFISMTFLWVFGDRLNLKYVPSFWFLRSGYQCSFHADIYERSFMPIHLF